MGVAVLQAYPPPPDKTVQQAVEILQRRILNLGATHTGQVGITQGLLILLLNEEGTQGICDYLMLSNYLEKFTDSTSCAKNEELRHIYLSSLRL